MKNLKLICTILLLGLSLVTFAQSGMWTWMHGSNTSLGATGNYGTMGVPSPTNDPPGRYQAAYWTDLQGDFWIFGGVMGGAGNDLWKFNVSTNQWTWIGGPQGIASPNAVYGTMGVPSSTTWPGGTGWGANCWTDHNGDLWLFGGSGYDATGTNGSLNDLWRYNIASNQWTWMNGSGAANGVGNYGTQGIASSSNQPPGLQETKSSYVDLNNNLWMFGGGSVLGVENTLWKYDIGNNQWTWMSGSSISGSAGNYGTLNVPSVSNQPPARWSYTKWVDQSGDFYIFSGDGTTNDTWRYNPTTNMWTWIGGDQYVGDTGKVTGYCNNSDYPKAMIENRTVQTFGCGNFFWEFGGCNNLVDTIFNSLWFYDATHNKWSLTSGAQGGTVTIGNYGTMGVANSNNIIPGKIGPSMWLDNSANVWIFGGFYIDAINGGLNLSNDLWKYSPDTACIHVPLSAFGNATINLPNTLFWCKDADTVVQLNGAHVISFTPASTAHYSTDSSAIIFHPTQSTTYYITLTGGCAGKDTQTVSFTINYVPQSIAAFSSSATVVPSSNPAVILTNESLYANTIAWYYNHQLVGTGNSISLNLGGIGEHCVTLIAYSNSGCNDSITQCINVVKENNITLPNAFTPNNDGNDDLFQPLINGDVIVKEFKIYNRWGQLVFNNPTQGWNGEYYGVPQPVSTFCYLLVADKKNIYGIYESIQLKGNVTLMR
ncbi:MAG: hypothetical protein RJA07_2178 [Bacteroidota bacterium]|jgi:gliding motility-associated-like protein